MAKRWLLGALLLLLLMLLVSISDAVAHTQTAVVTTTTTAETLTSSPSDRLVSVGLHAKWQRTPAFLEACEFLSDMNPDLVWPLVETRAKLAAAERVEWSAEDTLGFCQDMFGEDKRFSASLLRLSLQMFEKSPRVEMYRQVAQEVKSIFHIPADVSTFVVAGTAAFTSVQDLTSGTPSRSASQDGDANRLRFLVDQMEAGVQLMASQESSAPLFVLYGTPESPEFIQFHFALWSVVRERGARYVWRPFSPPSSQTRPQPLVGYGVELQVKSTEYSALNVNGKAVTDDSVHCRNPLMQSIFDEAEVKLPSDEETPCVLTKEQTELHKWDEKDVVAVGIRGSAIILDSASPLSTLARVTENWPVMAPQLLHMEKIASSRIKNAVQANGQIVGLEELLFFVNGRTVNMETASLFSIMRMIKEEHGAGTSLLSLGLDGNEVPGLLGVSFTSPPNRVDVVTDAPMNVIASINDLEKDPAYARWPRSLGELLKPQYPGRYPPIARNMYTLVATLDLGRPADLRTAAALYMILSQRAPLRIMLICVAESDRYTAFKTQQRHRALGRPPKDESKLPVFTFDSTETVPYAANTLFRHLRKHFGGPAALAFLYQTYVKLEEERQTEPDAALTLTMLRLAYQQVMEGNAAHPEYNEAAKMDFDHLLRSGTYTRAIVRSNEYASDRGLLGSSAVVLVNGLHLDSRSPESLVFTSVVPSETRVLIQKLLEGSVGDKTDIYALLTKNASKKLSLPVVSAAEFLPIPLTAGTSRSPFAATLSRYPLASSAFINRSAAKTKVPLLTLAALDPSTVDGLTMLVDAYESLSKSSVAAVDLGVIFLEPKNVKVAQLVHSTIAGLDAVCQTDDLTRHERLPLLRALRNALALHSATVAEGFAALGPEFEIDVDDPDLNGSNRCIAMHLNRAVSTEAEQLIMESQYDGFEKLFAGLIADIRMITSGRPSIIANGRMIKLHPYGLFSVEDWTALYRKEHDERAKAVHDQLREADSWKSRSSRDKAALVTFTTIMLSRLQMHQQVRRAQLPAGLEKKGSFTLDSNGALPFIRIEVVMDPLAQHASKAANFLQVLHRAGAHIAVWLSSHPTYSLPPRLRSFYRFITDVGATTDAPRVEFTEIPTHWVLTMNVLPPESWLVESVEAEEDLDNIRLGRAGYNVRAEFVLEKMVLTGQCYDLNRTPPRGLELVLRGGSLGEHVADTLVMANYGYFQLQGQPGLFTLALAEGRASEIYEIDKLHYLSTNNSTGGHVQNHSFLMDNFEGDELFVWVKKRAGHEKDSVLDEAGAGAGEGEESGGLWNSISSMFGAGGADPALADPTVHIFSVASGHLYERLLKIMILAVRKHTEAPLKFWFLKQFLSPQFKASLPHYAKKVGFEYELVAYKWPSWLNKQTEKQRIIWAYKVLFVDVIFPLSLRKIIFVDADQVVRADMSELNTMDLDGAPVAYTPFCDSRKEMDGFRFWKTGYWEKHLRGKPYHISALFVIDLYRFRRLAAGDHYRSIYDSLSKDPNSLSNLDQDLPNYAQHGVRIFSLPQEWLWCETWCSDETKPKAKTIDLCNNPLTKEAKLDVARRVAPEWADHDLFVREFEEEEKARAAEAREKETATAVATGSPVSPASPASVSPAPQVIKTTVREVGDEPEPTTPKKTKSKERRKKTRKDEL